MNESIASSTILANLIERVTGIIEGEVSISNKELIDICKEFGLNVSNGDPHIFHEIAETALNSLIQNKHGREMLARADPAKAVSEILRPLQARLPTQTWRSESQITFQQFSTPAAIAYLVTYLLNIQHGETVLEPSCGTGSLAVWAQAAGASVIANEIDPRRGWFAKLLRFEPFEFDGEFIDDLLPEYLIPDIVIANPPFTSSAGRLNRNSIEYGFNHIDSALRRLQRGGRFAVVLGENGSPRTRKGSRFWTYLRPDIELKGSIELPGQEFYRHGTSVKTTLILGMKPLSTESASSADLMSIPYIKAESVEDAFKQSIALNIRF